MERWLFLLFVLLCVVGHAQTTYVVSVGVADYEYINDLRFCEADVESFNNVMSRHTKCIYSLTGSAATHDNVLMTLRRVFSLAGKDDAVVLFFSGHGYPGGFCCYDMSKDSSRNGLSYAELQLVFKPCNAGRKMVFADACYSGGMRTRRQSATKTAQNSDVMFLLSSRTGEASQEMPKGPNGQFTRFLVRGLGGGADKNHDRIVTAKELYDFVHEGVKVATFDKQHPVMWGRFDNKMPVLSWKNK